MPDLESIDRPRKAVLWPATGVDGFGQPTVGAPVELDVMWNGVTREVRDPNGNSVTIDATVHVDRAVAKGSIMWLGALTDVPTPVVDAMQVWTYNGTEDLKGRLTTHWVLLMRFKGQLPTST